MDSDSIHHSYNHGIALTSGQGQGASGLVIANNVVARAVDHLFYLADGNEINNQFTNNLGLGAMTNSYSAAGEIRRGRLARPQDPARLLRLSR